MSQDEHRQKEPQQGYYADGTHDPRRASEEKPINEGFDGLQRLRPGAGSLQKGGLDGLQRLRSTSQTPPPPPPPAEKSTDA